MTHRKVSKIQGSSAPPVEYWVVKGNATPTVVLIFKEVCSNFLTPLFTITKDWKQPKSRPAGSCFLITGGPPTLHPIIIMRQPPRNNLQNTSLGG